MVDSIRPRLHSVDLRVPELPTIVCCSRSPSGTAGPGTGPLDRLDERLWRLSTMRETAYEKPMPGLARLPENRRSHVMRTGVHINILNSFQCRRQLCIGVPNTHTETRSISVLNDSSFQTSAVLTCSAYKLLYSTLQHSFRIPNRYKGFLTGDYMNLFLHMESSERVRLTGW